MSIVGNLELEISSGEDGSYWVAARSDAGDTERIATRFPLDERELEQQLQQVESALAWSAATVRRAPPKEERPAQQLGTQLFKFLFADEVREHLAVVRSQAARENTVMQVRLRVRPSELAALPWEFLYDHGRDDYLCLSTPLVRYLEVSEPLRPLAVTSPLRILGMVARPAELDVDHEKRRVQVALAGLEGAGGVQLSWVAGQTWHDLQGALDQGGWHIFHFIGHSRFDAERGEGVLVLAGEHGGSHPLAASDLGLLLGEHRSLRLAVLNSCESARASSADVFSSTAAVLTRRGIPAVVAMQYDISDQAAIAFARGLYTAVAGRFPVDQAVTRARRNIKLARRDTLEWATPVLYLRSPHGELFDLTAASAPAVKLATPESQTSRRPRDKLAHEAKPDPVAAQRQRARPLPDPAGHPGTQWTGSSTNPPPRLPPSQNRSNGRRPGGGASRHRPMWWTLGIVGALLLIPIAYLSTNGGGTRDAVPGVVGMSQSSATMAIARAGLRTKVVHQVSDVPVNHVIRTTPKGGDEEAANSVVTLYVSAGPPQVLVPNVIGDPQVIAQNILENDDLGVQVITAAGPASATPGDVFQQQPSSGALPSGSKVTIYVAEP